MKSYKRLAQVTARTWQWWGWTLFIVSALFYMVASWRSGDWLAFGGSLAFLLANISFVIPFAQTKDNE